MPADDEVAAGPALPKFIAPSAPSIPVATVMPGAWAMALFLFCGVAQCDRRGRRILGPVLSLPSCVLWHWSVAEEVVPSWRLLQENRLMMEAAASLVAERALAVTLSGTPANPPRALAFQIQKRLGLMSLPKVELVMPGMTVATMSNVEDYLTVTANQTLKLCTRVCLFTLRSCLASTN